MTLLETLEEIVENGTFSCAINDHAALKGYYENLIDYTSRCKKASDYKSGHFIHTNFKVTDTYRYFYDNTGEEYIVHEYFTSEDNNLFITMRLVDIEEDVEEKLELEREARVLTRIVDSYKEWESFDEIPCVQEVEVREELISNIYNSFSSIASKLNNLQLRPYINVMIYAAREEGIAVIRFEINIFQYVADLKDKNTRMFEVNYKTMAVNKDANELESNTYIYTGQELLEKGPHNGNEFFNKMMEKITKGELISKEEVTIDVPNDVSKMEVIHSVKEIKSNDIFLSTDESYDGYIN